MRRPWQIFSLFAVCLVVLLLAMGWTTWTVLRLDESHREARRETARVEAGLRRQEFVDQRVRLALWRMDALLGQVISVEINRPYYAYAPQPAEPDKSVGKGKSAAGNASFLPGPGVQLYFQINPDGSVQSPQVPLALASKSAVAAAPAVTAGDANVFVQRLRKFAATKPRRALEMACVAADPVQLIDSVDLGNTALFAAPEGNANYQQSVTANSAGGESQQAERADQQQRQIVGRAIDQQQDNYRRAAQVANENELGTRHRAFGQSFARDAASQNMALNSGNLLRPGLTIQQGIVRPVWLGDQLVLARRVTVGKQEVLQGCWLDWPFVKRQLIATVVDLLPEADLLAAREVPAADQWRLLATAPILPSPGGVSDSVLQEAGWIPPEGEPLLAEVPGWPLWAGLSFAWACVVVAAAAVAVLLWGATSLAERRAAFVAAVTHELRTPLTTFRLYAEMLGQGLVRDEEQRRQYLETLQGEADRLGHLVENVLAYARLERRAPESRTRPVALAELLATIAPRLETRAKQSGMEIVFDRASVDPTVAVLADPIAVEQVLFNLVDNACKYAAEASDRRIHLEATAERGTISVCVRDHGPGVERGGARRLFRPFCRSATTAAPTAPGVGLGLALCRRLARQMNGDVRCVPSSDGACFELVLRRGNGS